MDLMEIVPFLAAVGVISLSYFIFFMKKQNSSLEAELVASESLTKKSTKKKNKKKEKKNVEEKQPTATAETEEKIEKKEVKEEKKQEKKSKKVEESKPKKKAAKEVKKLVVDDGWEAVVEKPKGTKAKAEAKKQAEELKVEEQKVARAAAAAEKKQKKSKKSSKQTNNLPPELLAQAAAIEAKFSPKATSSPQADKSLDEWTDIKEEVRVVKKVEKQVVVEAVEDKPQAKQRAAKVLDYEWNSTYWRENQPDNIVQVPGKVADLIQSW